MEDFVHILEFLKVSNLVKDELLHLYNDINNSSNESDSLNFQFSENTIHFLFSNLREHPFPTYIIIQKLLCLWNPRFKKYDGILQSLCISVLSKLIEDIKKKDDDELLRISVKRALSLLSQMLLDDLKMAELNKTLIPTIFHCMNSNKINKHDLYLSLIPQRKLQLLSFLTTFENENCKQELNDHKRLFLNCVENKKHWLLKAIEVYNPSSGHSEIPYFLLEKVPLLKLLTLCNSESITIENIFIMEQILSNKHFRKSMQYDNFIQLFLVELERELKVITFCIENSVQQIHNLNTLYENTKTNSCLSTMVKFIDISVHENKEKIKSLLYENNCLLKRFYVGKKNLCHIHEDDAWDIVLFKNYSIITDMINIITSSEINTPQSYFEEVTKPLSEIAMKLSEIQSKNIQIEIIENIFSLLFLRYEYFIEDEKEMFKENTAGKNIQESNLNLHTNKKINDIKPSPTKVQQSSKTYGFICDDLILRDVLNTLKNIIVELQIKFSDIKKITEKEEISQSCKTRLENIHKYVADALWRLQLLTSASFYKDISAFGTRPQIAFCKCKEPTVHKMSDIFPNEMSSDSETELEISSKCTDSKNSNLISNSNINEIEQKHNFITVHSSDTPNLVPELIDKKKVKRKKNSIRRSETEKSSEGSETTASSGKLRRKLQRSSIADYPKESSDLLNYMLASPESLIYLCFGQEDFLKVKQVIQMYNLENSSISSEINFTEKLLHLRKELNSFFKNSSNDKMVLDNEVHKTPIENIRRVSGQVHHSTHVINLIENFFSTNFLPENKEYRGIINQFLSIHPYLKNYMPMNEIFMNFFDLALTLGNNYEQSTTLLKCAQRHDHLFDNNSDYSLFCENITYCFHETNSKIISENYTLSIAHILNDYKYSINPKISAKRLVLKNNLVENVEHFQNEINIDSFEQSLVLHSSCKTYLKILQSISDFQKPSMGTLQVNYMNRLFNYLKICSYLFKESYIKSGLPKINSYFAVLPLKRSDVVAKLVFELEKVNLLELEDIFLRMKSDLVYHLMINCFPKITQITFNENDEPIKDITNLDFFIEELTNSTKLNQEEGKLYQSNEKTLSYIFKNNWVFAYFLTLLYPNNKIKQSIEFNSNKTFCFDNLLELKRISVLKVLYKNKAILAALQHYIPYDVLSSYIQSLFNGKEMFEQASTKVIEHIYEIIDNLPERQVKNNKNFTKLKDLVLFHLTNDLNTEKSYKYSQQIKNISLRVKCVLDNLYRWKGDVCLDILKDLLTTFDTYPNEFQSVEITNWIKKIEVYQEICENSDYESWYDIYELSETPQATVEFEGYYEISEQFKYDPASLFLKLIDLKLANVSLKWIDLHQLKKEIIFLITPEYLKLIFEESFANLSSIESILNQLPISQSINLCKNLLKTLQNLKHLKFLVNYLINKDTENINTYQNIKIGIEIAYCMNAFEYDQILNIIDRPILIIEQLIMNTRLEKLSIVLKVVKNILKDMNPEVLTEDMVDIEKVDQLLRTYAEKSLDFRVNTHSHSGHNSSVSKSPEDKLLQSIDSASLDLTKQIFIMPTTIPDKSQWVQNNEVTECMCCRVTTFSMFNRRHHCRRCGRVVCGTCSTKRLIIASYDDILVRVCNDCYDLLTYQHSNVSAPSKSDKMSSTHSDSDFNGDYWQLTDDINHNASVREEFSYEYAPSVSLCLSILKLHSENENYPKFLLKQCDSIMKLIQTSPPGVINYEIDYSMLIHMLRSILIAAKVGCARCCLETGLVHCDRYLGQIDLLAMLANNDCLELLPCYSSPEGLFGSQINPQKFKQIILMGESLGSLGLKKLRDKLIENEQWHLALEVSTKAGLDKTGVLAAWGKTCLKAGCLQQARDKFQHCLEKVIASEEDLKRFNSEMDLTGLPVNNSAIKKLHHVESRTSLSSTGSISRPFKNPPLINDIIEILESLTYRLDPLVIKNADGARNSTYRKVLPTSTTVGISPSDPAMVILNKLANLKNIAQGNLNVLYPTGQLQEKVIINPKKNNTKKNIQTRIYMEKCYFDECIYYLKTYGSHSAIVQFYLKHEDITKALMYIFKNNLDTELYVEVYLTCLKNGCINQLQKIFIEFDNTLEKWKAGLTHICRNLEQTGLLHTLYQLQVWMGDNVRAAMTCIKFYQSESTTYSDLCANLEHLHVAQTHLKQELESDQWVQIEPSARRMSTNSQDCSKPLVYKMDPREIDKHINTVWRQMEVTKFLASCERSGRHTLQILPEIFPFKEDLIGNNSKTPTIPTLFGTKIEKVQLTVLVIISGGNVEEGFGIAFRIIEDYQLNPTKVYCIVAKYLVSVQRYSDVEKLVSCIYTSGVSEQTSTQICDELLSLAVRTIGSADTTGNTKQEISHIESLIKLIKDISIKITAYIESKQLKAAYLLAVRYNRMRDVRRVLREAERLNQTHIRNICVKRLAQSSP